MSDFDRASLVNEAMIDAYIRMLFEYVDWQDGDTIRLRGIGEKGTAQEGKFREKAVVYHAVEIMEHARRWAEHDVGTFIVPAVMTDGDEEEHVRLFTTICADLDSGDTDEKLDHLQRYIGTPSMTVASGGRTETGHKKRHVYWRLKEPTDRVREVAALREAIAIKIGDDPSFKRITQIIRIPGTVHGKNGEANLVRIEAQTPHEYEL